MECGEVRPQLRELERGLLEPPEEAELRRHLAGCAACQHEAEAERLLDEALARELAPARAPPPLRRQLEQLMAPHPTAGVRPPRRLARPARQAAALAAAALVIAGVAFLAGRASLQSGIAAGRLADELVSDHLRALASVHPYDVESSDTHQVKPWFEGRLPFAPVVPGDVGELRLLGGSVGYVQGEPAAVVSYGLRRHRLTLLAFPAAAAGSAPLPARGPPRHEARSGIGVALWAAGDVGYALVADVGAAELGALAQQLCAETRRASFAP